MTGKRGLSEIRRRERERKERMVVSVQGGERREQDWERKMEGRKKGKGINETPQKKKRKGEMLGEKD